MPINTDERNSPLHRLFRLPFWHHLKRRLIAKEQAMPQLLAKYLARIPENNAVLLDLGCGTGRNRALRKEGWEYYGVDLNPHHIAHNTALNEPHVNFICDDLLYFVSQAPWPKNRPVVIMMVGILHHLHDDVVRTLMKKIRDIPAPRYLITADPVKITRQSFIARTLIALDRGAFIRTPDAYAALLAHAGGEPQAVVHSDLLRLPYNHYSSFTELNIFYE